MPGRSDLDHEASLSFDALHSWHMPCLSHPGIAPRNERGSFPKRKGLSERPVNVIDENDHRGSPLKTRILQPSTSVSRATTPRTFGHRSQDGLAGSSKALVPPVPRTTEQSSLDDAKSDGSMEMDMDIGETLQIQSKRTALAGESRNDGASFPDQDDADDEDDDSHFQVSLRTVKLLDDRQENLSGQKPADPARGVTGAANSTNLKNADGTGSRRDLFTPVVRKIRPALPRSRSKLGGPRRIVKEDDEKKGSDIDSRTENGIKAVGSKTKNTAVGDLSYIKNWDPETWRRRSASKTPTSSLGSSSQLSSSHPSVALSPLVEESAEIDVDDTLAAGRRAPIAEKTATMSAEDMISSASSSASSGNPLSTQNLSMASSSTSSTASVRSSNASLPPNQQLSNPTGANHDAVCVVNGKSYMKLGIIGKGGSSQVFRVMDNNNNIFALKKVNIDSHTDRRMVEMYTNEITLLEKLRGNPRIVELVESQVDTQAHCIQLLMEIGETDLSKLLEMQKAAADRTASTSTQSEKRATLPSGLSQNFVRLLWQQMLEAVDAIHEEHIVHGDLKPANFLLVQGTLKLIDFGIAKAIQSEDTTSIVRESQVGTLNYMSPEALLDQSQSAGDGPLIKLGRASDVWSLGCILYQLVYGKPPFAHLRFVAKLQALTDPTHEILFPEIADELLLDVVKSCLQRSPEDRLTIGGSNKQAANKRVKSLGSNLLNHPYLHPQLSVSWRQQHGAASSAVAGGDSPAKSGISRAQVSAAVSHVVRHVVNAIREEAQTDVGDIVSGEKVSQIANEVYRWLEKAAESESTLRANVDGANRTTPKVEKQALAQSTQSTQSTRPNAAQGRGTPKPATQASEWIKASSTLKKPPQARNEGSSRRALSTVKRTQARLLDTESKAVSQRESSLDRPVRAEQTPKDLRMALENGGRSTWVRPKNSPQDLRAAFEKGLGTLN